MTSCLRLRLRVEPEVPNEDVAGTAPELIAAGTARHVGMPEPGVAKHRRAHAVQLVAAMQNEYLLWCRAPATIGVLATCDERGTGLVPYNPLARAS